MGYLPCELVQDFFHQRYYRVVATQIIFIFTPNLGEILQFDLRIFCKWVGSTTNSITLDSSDISSDSFIQRLEKTSNFINENLLVSSHACLKMG